jgi:thymidylate synthase
MEITGESIDELIRVSLTTLTRQGHHNEPTKGPNLELTGVLLSLSNPLNRISRTESKNTIFSCLGELFWYLSGSEDVNHVSYYLKDYINYAENDGSVGGAYGPRLLGTHNSVNQLENIISILESKPTSRQAVIQIFDKRDLVDKKKDIPCTLNLQFILRDKKLELIVTMRSNDVFIGFPHDVFCFTMIQELVANELSLRLNSTISLGTYKHFVGSFHIYDSALSKVQKYTEEGYTSLIPVMTDMPKNSFSLIPQLLQIEKDIRLGNDVNLKINSLPVYWADIFVLLKAFNVSKRVDGLEEVKIQLNALQNNHYKPIIQKLIRKLEQTNEYQK